MANLYDLLSSRFELVRTSPAFRLGDGSILTYGWLEDAAARVAGRLAAAGVRPGDRIALVAAKVPEAIAIYLGVLKAGAVFLPLNPAYTSDELAYFRGDAEPAVRIDDAAGFVDGAMFAPPLQEAIVRDDGDLAALIYTSGTTGRSKGTMLSHGNLAANASALHAAWGFSADDVLLHALPIFHVHGLFVATHSALISGAPMEWLARFEETEVLAALARSTVMMGVPTFYTRLLADPRFDGQAAANVRLFVCGSAPLTPSTFDAFEARTGQRILERYGMSEAVIITTHPLDGDRLAGSVGYPMPGVELRAGVEGVIEIKGPSVFSGYWRNPEKTAEDFTADGFFATGDVGHVDPDGRVWISGRAKDLIISGGFNVYPAEVELVLDALPGVVESAVVGAPHPDFGEGVVAVVVGTGNEAAIIAAARERLAPYKAPKRVVFVDDLPRNAMGKVQKAALRGRYARLFEI